MRKILRVLAVISNQSLLAKIETLLHRRTLEVNHVSSGAGALVLAGNLRYELVIIQSPLPDLHLEQFVSTMRGLDSVSVQANFLVLTAAGTEPPALAEASDSVRTLPADADAARIHDVVSELLGVAARRAARLLIEIEVKLGQGPSRRLYQSQNLSQSGILLRGGRSLAPGSRVRFELALPGGDKVSGHALVVRHTSPSEPVAGAALQFLDLGAADQDRIRDFVYAGLIGEEEPLQVAGGEG